MRFSSFNEFKFSILLSGFMDFIDGLSSFLFVSSINRVFSSQNSVFKFLSVSFLNFFSRAGFRRSVLEIFLSFQFISKGFSESFSVLSSFSGFSFIDEISDGIEFIGTFFISKDDGLISIDFFF